MDCDYRLGVANASSGRPRSTIPGAHPKLAGISDVGGSKIFLGVLEAPSKVKAIELAIRTYDIINPEHQRHLVAEVRD